MAVRSTALITFVWRKTSWAINKQSYFFLIPFKCLKALSSHRRRGAALPKANGEDSSGQISTTYERRMCEIHINTNTKLCASTHRRNLFQVHTSRQINSYTLTPVNGSITMLQRILHHLGHNRPLYRPNIQWYQKKEKDVLLLL